MHEGSSRNELGTPLTVIASDTEFRSPPLSGRLAALRGQLRGGGRQSPPEILGPVAALGELERVCEAMLGGRGGPRDDDRGSLVKDIKSMRGALGPAVAAALGQPLNVFISDLSGSILKTPQGARALHLSATSLLERLVDAAVARAAWLDVVETFEADINSAELCEQRIMILREICEARGQEWGTFGTSHGLERLLSDDASAASQYGAGYGPVEGDFAGLTEQTRVDMCADLVAQDALRGDVAVWFLIQDAYIDFWQRIGPLELFNAHLMPEGVRSGGNLEQINGYQPPPELEDWEEASLWLGKVDVPNDEHAVLARVWMPGSLVQRAPTKAAEILRSLVEVANDNSDWRIQDGAAGCWIGQSWFGSILHYEPPTADHGRFGHPVFEPTGKSLAAFEPAFVERLAVGDEVAQEAIEDARWVIAVSRAPTAAQRVALGTRAVERVLSVARAENENWKDVSRRYLLAPWTKLQIDRWIQAAAVNARMGVAKTHGRGSEIFGWVDHRVYPRAEGEPGISYQSAVGIADLESYFGPLDALIARGLTEHRSSALALRVLNQPKVAQGFLKEIESRFEVLLARLARSRNAIIHGQRPSAATLGTIDGFVRDLGRLVAADMMRSAETGEAALARLQEWRVELAEVREALDSGRRPVGLPLFSD